VFNATFSNISAISWRPVLVVEGAEVPSQHYDLRLRVKCTLFCNLQSRARTYAVLVIGLYELLGNPTHWATLEKLNESSLLKHPKLIFSGFSFNFKEKVWTKLKTKMTKVFTNKCIGRMHDYVLLLCHFS